MTSNAVSPDNISRTSGYKLKKGFFGGSTSFLPQKILIIGASNKGLSIGKKMIMSSSEAGKIYGYGSSIHSAMRILRPTTDDGVGSIPTYCLDLPIQGGAPAKIEIEVTGVATSDSVHKVLLNGRDSLDGKSFSFVVDKGDDAKKIAQKIATVTNSSVATPLSATPTESVVSFTAKCDGNFGYNVSVLNENNDSGITYAVKSNVAGKGTVDFTELKDAFDEEWITCVVNCFGVTDESLLNELERINGVPFLEKPTGRFNPMVFKPFIVFNGTTASTGLDVISRNRSQQVTNSICVAPNSKGLPLEVSANVAYLYSLTMNNTPELDVNAMFYPDMPTAETIGEMADYAYRDYLVKNGISTVILKNNNYQIQDLVTTYFKDDENPYHFSYCRNLNLDFNIKYLYSILEERHLKDKVIVLDGQYTTSSNTIRTKDWKAIVVNLFSELAESALIQNPEFSKNSLIVEVNQINKNRFDTYFRYQRTGVLRVASTDAEAGF